MPSPSSPGEDRSSAFRVDEQARGRPLTATIG